VQGLKAELVEAEFHKSYFAKGKTKKAKRDAKAAAFKRAIADAVAKGVIVTREMHGEEWIWLSRPDPTKNA